MCIDIDRGVIYIIFFNIYIYILPLGHVLAVLYESKGSLFFVQVPGIKPFFFCVMYNKSWGIYEVRTSVFSTVLFHSGACSYT